MEFVTEEIFNAATSETTDEPEPESNNIEEKRKELLLLSSDGEIAKSVSYINKASDKAIEKLYAKWETQQREKNSEFLCDLFISKFAAALGGLDAIETPEEIEKELLKILFSVKI